MAVLRRRAIDELHAAVDELCCAWDALAINVGRQLEGWDDPASNVTDAQQRVRLATGGVNAALEQGLMKAGL